MQDVNAIGAVSIKALTIRSFPPALADALTARSGAGGKSLNQTVVDLLGKGWARRVFVPAGWGALREAGARTISSGRPLSSRQSTRRSGVEFRFFASTPPPTATFGGGTRSWRRSWTRPIWWVCRPLRWARCAPASCSAAGDGATKASWMPFFATPGTGVACALRDEPPIRGDGRGAAKGGHADSHQRHLDRRHRGSQRHHGHD